MSTNGADTLPAGWTQATIGELITADGVFIDGDWVESKDQDPDGDIRLIQLADIGDGLFTDKSDRHLTQKKAHELGCTFLKKGDVLVARMPDPLGRCCLFPLKEEKRYVTVVDVCIVRVSELQVNPKFVAYAINSPTIRAKIADYQSGSTRKRISRGNLAKIRLPIAPLREQCRIVAKVEESFSELDKGIEALTIARQQLKAYRQSVLKHAFETNSDDWPEYTIGQLVTDIRYGTAKKCAFDPTKTPVLRIPNIASGRIDLEDLKHTDFTVDELEKLRLELGDILLVRSNGSVSLVGLSAVVTASAAEFAYAGYLIRLRLKQDIILPEFLNLYLHSPKVRIVIERQARSTSGVHNINSDEIRAISIRVPSIPSQQAIIDAIERFATQIDALESCTTTERQRGAALRQAILAKAFCGQIVAQDPKDEPAFVLLERIRAERNGASAMKSRNGRNGHGKNSKNGKKQFA